MSSISCYDGGELEGRDRYSFGNCCHQNGHGKEKNLRHCERNGGIRSHEQDQQKLLSVEHFGDATPVNEQPEGIFDIGNLKYSACVERGPARQPAKQNQDNRGKDVLIY